MKRRAFGALPDARLHYLSCEALHSLMIRQACVYTHQGDIVAILDSNSATVVQYKYDAWGKPISKTGM